MGWSGWRGRWVLGGCALTLFAMLLGLETWREEEELTVTEIATEAVGIALLVGCSVCSALLSFRLREQEADTLDLRAQVARLREGDRQWRADLANHFQELGAAIERQFAAWGCTRAEQEVGLLLLKGFSHKEIARLRNTSEATIRQQAAALYQKSGLSGRAALSAFFLEELLQPPEPAPRARPAGPVRAQ